MALIQCLAMGAALVAIIVGLVDGYGVLVTLKRAVISYLGFSIVGSLIGIVFRVGIEDDWIRDSWQRHVEEQRRREQKRRQEREHRRQQREQQLTGTASQSDGRKQPDPNQSREQPQAKPVGV